MERKELLGGIIEQFQLTPQEIIENWVNEKKVDSVFLSEMAKKAKTFEYINFVSSKKFVTPSIIKPGMYAYADGLIHPDFIPEAQLQSIIGYADEKQILSWCLRGDNQRWSDRDFLAGTEDKTLSGKEATGRIRAEGKKVGIATPAADFAFDYAEDGVIRETAFLPSYKEGMLLIPGCKAVDKALAVAELPRLESVLFLSSESNIYYSLVLCTGSGTSQSGLVISYKSNDYYVCPVLDLSHWRK